MHTASRFLFSVAVLATPFLIYLFVIRPRLEARFSETYAHINSFWARVWARIVAFRSWVIATVGVWCSEVPAILEQFQYIDMSDWWSGYQATMRLVVIILLVWNISRKTTPVGQPEAGAGGEITSEERQ